METVLAEKPDVIINCAAWTDVDSCESNPERAYAANSQGPENLAHASRRSNALLVSISTDYVFDGTKDGFYTQRDDPNPLSVYAHSKLDGERRAQAANARTVIVRTGFVFGTGGRNFLSKILEHARNGVTLSAIADAYGTPTYTYDLARRLRELADVDVPGIFHVVNEGAGASFAEFTRETLSMAGYGDVELNPVQMDSLKRPAPRPRNSRLRCLLSPAIGLAPMPDWRVALREFVQEDFESASAPIR